MSSKRTKTRFLGRLIPGSKPAAMPDFIPVVQPVLVDEVPSVDKWVHEVKFDGYRMEVCVDEGATITSRQELDWTHRFPVLAKTFRALPARIIGRGGRVPNRQGDF